MQSLTINSCLEGGNGKFINFKRYTMFTNLQVQMFEESRYHDNNVVQYQNTMPAPPAQDQDDGKWDIRTSAPRCHTVEDGKWLNSAGLLYTFPHFDLSSDLRCRPPPTQDETEYCTLRLI